MFSFQRALPKTLICSLAALAFLLFSAGSLLAQTQNVAPVLVPFQVTAIAGNSQTSVGGYSGNGVPALNATLNSPSSIAVDSVGNVYFADQSNALIREINAQTGIIQNIAGVPPSNCTGVTCTVTSPGCSDGVPAVGNQVGSRVDGMAVDGYGNLYFVDYNYQGAWVIYKGGAQVANFISVVDNATVSSPSAVKPGYIYHIAGTAVPKAGGGCSATSGSSAATDNVLANSALFHDPISMGIDAQGNIYIQDFANSVVRVVNTQPTTQTFFGVSVPTGYVAAIVGCNKTYYGGAHPCPSAIPAFGIPASSALYSNELNGMTVDQYGNIYELDTKGATGDIYAGVAYAGGTALAHLINTESVQAAAAGVPNTTALTATPGDFYQVINNIYDTNAPTTAPTAVYAWNINDLVLRPNSLAIDNLGNIYLNDYHWIAIYRVDVNSSMAFKLNHVTATIAGTAAAPVPCANTLYNSMDAYGDGCPISAANIASGGIAYEAFDPAGNLYFTDEGDQIVRKVSIGTQYPTTNVGSSVLQTVQVHFDPSNLPTSSTAAFSISSGASDFTITSSSCSNLSGALDTSQDCYANITFKPSAPGARKGTLLVTTTNGSNYPFPLTGFGNGPQIAIDGGAPATLQATGLGNVAAVAVDIPGNIYIADPTNNRVVELPAGGGTQTTIGTGLSMPKGVAVDPAGNVYIADTGNNRLVEVAALTGAQTVLNTAGLGATPLNKPQGLALDNTGNLYVADTGNGRIVEYSPEGLLGAVPLLAYTGAQTLTSPVGVAVDHLGNVYVADSSNSTGIIKIAAGGGDFQTAASGSVPPPATIVPFGSGFVTAPSGIVIDGAGDLYVSDGTGNKVEVIPAASGPGSQPYSENFPGLNGPSGLALDLNGNLYVADTGNSRVLVDNRTNVNVNFGNQAQFQPAATAPLTVLNIGTAAYTPTSPFATVSGATAEFSESDTCAASNFATGVLPSGLHCSQTISFVAPANGPFTGSVSVQGGAANISLTGTGENPLVKMTLAVTSPATGPVYGSPAAITLTATQPNGANIPSGTVTFNYTINGVAQPAVTQTLSPNGSGGAATVLNLNNLLAARVYVINATYNGDSADSITNAAPLTFTVPGLPITVVSSSVSYTYGQAVPALTGTVTGILPADQAGISIKFVTAATSTSPVGVYPITVVLSGGNAANYTIPNAVTSTGAPATVTENQATLTYNVGNFSAAYGQPNITYLASIAQLGGLLPSDQSYLSLNFTPAQSTFQPVGTYPIVPTISLPTPSGYDDINNYKLNITNGTLTVTQATPVISVAQLPSAILPTALTSGTINVTVAQSNPVKDYGVPTGTVVMTDVFTPLSTTGAGTPINNPNITLTLVNGKVSYTPTSTTLGTHVYTFTYSGDTNFVSVNTTALPTSLIIDNADFTVVSTTSPIIIAPGILPGGNASIVGEQAATPETATVYIAPILGSTETVTLTCAVPASYITCTLSPSSITLTGTATQTSTVSVSTPGTLPVNFTGQLERPGQLSGRRVAFAAIPLALLTLLPLCFSRRRIRISRLMVLLVSVALLAGASGCGGNNVKFFTPVPAGPSSVVITGTSGSFSRSFTVPLNIQ